MYTVRVGDGATKQSNGDVGLIRLIRLIPRKACLVCTGWFRCYIAEPSVDLWWVYRRSLTSYCSWSRTFVWGDDSDDLNVLPLEKECSSRNTD